LVGTLTTGVILVGYALELGANNAVVGLLAAVPLLFQLVQLPAIFLVEKIRRRRVIAVASLVLARLLLVPMALLPLFPTGPALASLVVLLAINAALHAVAACSWNSWVRDLVPPRLMGRYFARRQFAALAGSILISLAAGLAVDYAPKLDQTYRLPIYGVLFIVAVVAGIISAWYLWQVPEPPMAPPRRVGLRETLAGPFRDRNFTNAIRFLAAWNFAVNLAAPFFGVYLLQKMSYPMFAVVLFAAVSQAANLAGLRVWGALSDRFSNKTVLRVTAPLFLLCILAWLFVVAPDTAWGRIGLLLTLHLLMGFSTAAIGLASGNLSLKLAPRGQATAYLAASGLATAVASGLAPIAGGFLAEDLAQRELSFVIRWVASGQIYEWTTLRLQHWDFFFASATLLGLYALHRLSHVREVGEVEEKILISEMINMSRRTLFNLSPIGGIRFMSVFPFGMLTRQRRG
jgi:MFS family permease